MNYRIALAALLAAAISVTGACRDPELAARSAGLVGEAAPEFTLPAHDGKSVTLGDFKGKYVVLEWINFDCPFVRKHYNNSDNMVSLQKKFQEKGVVWLTVNSSAPGKQGHFAPAEIGKRMQEVNWSGNAYLLDPDGKVGRMYGAQTTPHMYIIDPAGKLIYAGAIDDNSSSSASSIEGATNYVDLALGQAMNGERVSNPSTKSYGCSVKY